MIALLFVALALFPVLASVFALITERGEDARFGGDKLPYRS